MEIPMSDITIHDIVGILSDSNAPISATALSRVFGFSKLSAVVKRKLEEAVRNGDVQEVPPGDGRNYVAYTVDDTSAPVTSSSEQEHTSSGHEATLSATQDEEYATVKEAPKYTLPDNNYGYIVEEVRHAGKVQGFNIQTPDKKLVEMSPTERLVVFNEDLDNRYVVGTPEDLLNAIHAYTSSKGWGTYVIRQMSSEKSKPVSQAELAAGLPTDVVFFLNIERHNKAGIRIDR